MHPPFTTVLCVATAAVSLIAWWDRRLYETLLFTPGRIRFGREWYRLLSVTLVHGDLMHLVFNLYSLYSFGQVLEWQFGRPRFFLIYAGAGLASSLLSLYLHRHDEGYRSVGASGAISGVIFASIFMMPGIGVGLPMIPIMVPGPVYAFVYLVGTFVAIRRGVDHIAHDAHFGGALAGMLFALALTPRNCFSAPYLFTGSLLFSIAALIILVRHPGWTAAELLVFVRGRRRSNLRYQRYDDGARQRKEQEEADRILEKIAAHGIHSVSAREREKLARLSERLKRKR